MGGFAVLDFETTGIQLGYHHRVVEVGVVLLDRGARPCGEYHTLINPMRDLGAQEIHGISAADLRLAPTFADIAGDLAEILAGRVLVAHQAVFDLKFLAAEYQRCGYEIPRLWDGTVCTMQLANYYLEGNLRSLAACCEAVGVPYINAHNALDDARAAAGLLATYLDSEPDAPWWDEAREASRLAVWPSVAPRGTPTVPRGSSAIGAPILDDIVRRLEKFVEPPFHNEYFALVDQVLADGKLTLTERRALDRFACERELSPTDVAALNRSYMMAVVRACTDDQILTQLERARIIQCAILLGIDGRDLMGLLAIAVRDAYSVDGAVVLRSGDQIALTGMSDEEKGALTVVAEGLGVEVWPRVTKRCSLVIARDSASQSGKARRAHELGVPVIDIDMFHASVDRLRGGSLLDQ